MRKAVIHRCPGMAYPEEHSYKDFCSSCAPYWEEYPACPVCKLKLSKSDGGAVPRGSYAKCKGCGTKVRRPL